MVSDRLAYFTRAAHDLGLATWFGGSMFGKFAHNPSVQAISDQSAGQSSIRLGTATTRST